MKHLTFLLLALVFFSTAQAENPPHKAACNCALTTAVTEFLQQHSSDYYMPVKLKPLTDAEFTLVVHKLCTDILMSSAIGFKPERFKNIILKAEGVSPNASEQYKNQVVYTFLNKYKQKLICPGDSAKGHYSDIEDWRPLHLYKTAILNGVIDLFDEFLTRDGLYHINFNAYQIVDGKKETVVDYINKLIATHQYSNDQLEMLKKQLKALGAKKGVDLK